MRQIKQALGISGILTAQSAWQHRGTGRGDRGAQIDLVIDRPDNVVNLCEIRYSDAPYVIDRRYAEALRGRAEIFRSVTGASKSLFTTFVTVHGIAAGAHASEIVTNDIRAAALFS